MQEKEVYMPPGHAKRVDWLMKDDKRMSVEARIIPQLPKPLVKEGHLPQNEEAFFAGLCLGNFWKKQIDWQGTDYVTVTTRSKDLETVNTLKLTLGIWGKTSDNTKGTKAYLHPQTFNFLLDNHPHAKFFNSRSRYAPFLLGVLVGSLSDKEKRISYEDRPLYKDKSLSQIICEKFQEYYGFSIGKISPETKREKKLSVITVTDVNKVISVLTQEKSVKELPFLKALTLPRTKINQN